MKCCLRQMAECRHGVADHWSPATKQRRERYWISPWRFCLITGAKHTHTGEIIGHAGATAAEFDSESEGGAAELAEGAAVIGVEGTGHIDDRLAVHEEREVIDLEEDGAAIGAAQADVTPTAPGAPGTISRSLSRAARRAAPRESISLPSPVPPVKAAIN